MASATRDTETEAYVFIRATLKALGWDIRNPSRAEGGRLWTQNQCLADPEIRRWLGAGRPENIVKVGERVLWVIEAKRSHGRLEQAYSEALERATTLNQSEQYKVLFVSGVAGNDADSYLIKNGFFDGRGFVPITLNGIPTTGLLSESQLKQILSTGCPDIAEPKVDEKLFLDAAQRISGILHLGAVPPHQRAGVMASLLLSMLGDTPPNIESQSPSVLVHDINGRVLSALRRDGKPEFHEYVRIALPAAADNHVKLRGALVKTLQELNNLNIRSAMNSGADWLGTFYEVFLKYASWAQKLGIVLTPRHITRFVAEVMDVQVNDLIFDPTCGTGGFLVAAFDRVRQQADAQQLARFKQCGVFGVEQEDGIAALAVVNMIFRGDGKNNIKAGDCFHNFLASATERGVATAKFVEVQSASPPITKVMMNPPFAIKRSDEKEYKFVDHALKQMQHGGVLFSVLPYSAMVRPGAYRTWRRHSLLAGNTLLAVITFPGDLFYPVGVTTLGVFVRKGTPHPESARVLWIRALNDGLLKSKGKRLVNAKASDDLAKVKDLLKAFLHSPSCPVDNIEQFQKAAPIDMSDELLELVPEAYVDQALPTEDQAKKGLAEAVRNTLAYLIKVDRAVIQPELLTRSRTIPAAAPRLQRFTAQQLFQLDRGDFHSIADLDPGEHVTISRVGTDNGFVGFYDKPNRARIWPAKTITVSTVTGDAFFQPTPFIATDNVVLCTPKPEYAHLTVCSLFFIAWALNTAKWRYSYGRQCYKTKFAYTEFFLPVTDAGVLDERYMEALVNNTPYWPLVEATIEQHAH